MASINAGYRQTNDRTYLHNWISATCPASTTDLSSGQIRNSEDDECLAIRFHACCLRALQKICQHLSAIDPGKLDLLGLAMLERLCSQELGKLYLCGESFTTREVGKALDRADELRNSLLKILCGIGSLLAHGKHTVAIALVSCTSILPKAASRRPSILREKYSMSNIFDCASP